MTNFMSEDWLIYIYIHQVKNKFINKELDGFVVSEPTIAFWMQLFRKCELLSRKFNRTSLKEAIGLIFLEVSSKL